MAQPLNLLFTGEAIAAQLNAVKAKMVFVPPPGARGASMKRPRAPAAQVPSLERIVTLPMDGRVAFDGEPLDAGARCRQIPKWPAPTPSPRCCRPAGRPASPKIVPLTHRNIVASAAASMLAYDPPT